MPSDESPTEYIINDDYLLDEWLVNRRNKQKKEERRHKLGKPKQDYQNVITFE